MQLTVAITGASGVIYGKRLLEVLKKANVKTNLIVSKAAAKVIQYELPGSIKELQQLANHVYAEDDFAAPLASGSFITDGMVIIPCSMKTAAGIAHGYAENLILRAADVALKEKRKLILVPRETPLSAIHLRNLLDLAMQGATIVPAMPAFYHSPKHIDDLIDFVVGKVCDSIGLSLNLFQRWSAESHDT